MPEGSGLLRRDYSALLLHRRRTRDLQKGVHWRLIAQLGEGGFDMLLLLLVVVGGQSMHHVAEWGGGRNVDRYT